MKSLQNLINAKMGLKTFAFLTLAACGFTACKKTQAIPAANSQDIGLNFYSASDVMKSAYSAKGGAVAVFVDQYQELTMPLNYAEASFSHFPVLSYFEGLSPEYPVNFNMGSIPNFAHYVAGSHRLMFTDTTNTIVTELTINPPAESFTTLYLADDITMPGAHAAYTAIAVQEDRSPVDSGKVGIRFIHLSPDAGPLTCTLLMPDGNTGHPFAQALQFKEASAYQYFDAGTANAGIVHFNLNNDANGAEVITGAPFKPGKRYAIVIDGFLTSQQRQIAGKNPDGSLNYTPIIIAQNLKAELRTIY